MHTCLCVYMLEGGLLDDLINKIGKSPEAKERVCFRNIICNLCGREPS